MASEFRLSYTASDINEKLGKIDSLANKSEIPSKLSELTNDIGFATEDYVNNAVANIDIPKVDLSGYAQKSELPTKVSQLENDKGYLTSFTETDPTVPAWAKAATKPTYTAAEVGAQPANCVINANYDMDIIDKTYAEIEAAYESGATLILNHDDYKFDFVCVDDGFVFERMYTQGNKIVIDRCYIYGDNDGWYVNGYGSIEPSASVQSINGKTGAVVLTAEDVGALPDSTIIPTVPSNVSAFTNDAGYLTEHQSLEGFATESYVDNTVANIDKNYIKSINGVTPDENGNVEIDVSDSGGNTNQVDYVVQDTAPEDTSVLWVDPTDNSDDGFQEAVNAALAQAKASGEFDGADGYTPVKGVDYYTEEEKAEFVNEVLSALPTWTGGSY